MKKSFAEVSTLTSDEFAAYFNGQVIETLGRAGAEAALTADEQDRIKEIRAELFEKTQRAKTHPSLTALAEEIYSELEKEHIEVAAAALRSGLTTELGTQPSAAFTEETSSLVGLSKDPLRHIASYLIPQEHVALAKVSKLINTDLKGALNPERVKAIKKFLQHVAYGQQDEAEAMLRTDPSLLTKSGEFTDYSGRSFICTAYEYAYWAKDTHMRRMLESFMDEEAKSFLRERIDRMEEIDPETGQARGLVYWQNGVKHRSAHFDLTPLITALQNHFTSARRIDNWEVIEAAWLKVGVAQRDVPAHVAQEYCRPDRAFCSQTFDHLIPDFTEAILPRVLIFGNIRTDRDNSWFPLAPPGSGLGFDFSVNREMQPDEALCWAIQKDHIKVEIDLEAVRRLDAVRTTDLKDSRDFLNSPALSSGLSR
ncbi:MAG TPA: hypothetical protein VD770_04675 [Coxiellaceae bacterium]|nr:hypothetical protein [Coxiellaceae bacterium]